MMAKSRILQILRRLGSDAFVAVVSVVILVFAVVLTIVPFLTDDTLLKYAIPAEKIPNIYREVKIEELIYLYWARQLLGISSATIALTIVFYLLWQRPKIESKLDAVISYLNIDDTHAIAQILSDEEWAVERDRILRTLENSDFANSNPPIKATSSSYPIPSLHGDYFHIVAECVLAKNGPIYQLLIADNPSGEQPGKFDDEMKKRIAALNQCAKSKRTRWTFGEEFSARKMNNHSGIDYLIVSDHVFINLKLQASDANGRRGCIHLHGKRSAALFNTWFDSIYRDGNLSQGLTGQELVKLGCENYRERDMSP